MDFHVFSAELAHNFTKEKFQKNEISKITL